VGGCVVLYRLCLKIQVFVEEKTPENCKHDQYNLVQRVQVNCSSNEGLAVHYLWND